MFSDPPFQKRFTFLSLEFFHVESLPLDRMYTFSIKDGVSSQKTEAATRRVL